MSIISYNVFQVVNAKKRTFSWIMCNLNIAVLVMCVYVTMGSRTKNVYRDCCKSNDENTTAIVAKQTIPPIEAATTSMGLRNKAKTVAAGPELPIAIQIIENLDLNMIDLYGDTGDTETIWDDFSAWHDDEDLYQSYLNQESSIIAALIEGSSDKTLH